MPYGMTSGRALLAEGLTTFYGGPCPRRSGRRSIRRFRSCTHFVDFGGNAAGGVGQRVGEAEVGGDQQATDGVRPARSRWATWSVIVAVSAFAVVDVVRTLLAIGGYEYQIIVVTHGNPDVPAPMRLYELFDLMTEELRRLPDHYVPPSTVYQFIWTLALVVAVATTVTWLYQVRAIPRPDRATVGWIGAAVLLKVVVAVYDAVAAPPSPSIGGVLATRPIAYPLWTVSSVVLVVAVRRVISTILHYRPQRNS